jgi:membrane protease YdiL (CAAX protease family)
LSEVLSYQDSLSENFRLSNLKLSIEDTALALVFVACWIGSYVFRLALAPAILYPLLLATSFYVEPLKRMRQPAIFLCAAWITVKLVGVVPVLAGWPAAILLIAAATVFALKKTASVDLSARWNFRFSKMEILSIFGIAIPSFIVLVFYYRAFPEVAKSWPLPEMPPWSLPVVIVGAAGINGLAEELVYRFAFQRALLADNGVAFSILVQALAFGFLHFQNGFPRGWIGVALTTLFGVLMGVQYYRTRSIALAWVTHSLTDALMFAVIVYQ